MNIKMKRTPQGTQVIQDAQVAKDTQVTQDKKDEPEKPNFWSPWGKTKKFSECHDPNEKIDDIIRLQAAYHKRSKECHKVKRIYKNDYLAYRKCTKCHE